MKKRWLVLAVAGALILSQAQAAQAGFWVDFGRWLGWGWSEGYHANSTCHGCQETWEHFPVHNHLPQAPRPIPEVTTNFRSDI